jgi:transcriptional regulator with XRE-family HTH domain
MPVGIQDQLGPLIARRRKDLGLSLRELGARAGVSHVTALKIENGTGNTRIEVIDGVLAGLGLERSLVSAGD